MAQQTIQNRGAAPATEAHKPSLKERAAHEARTFLVIFVYLFILFSLFVLYEAIILGHEGIQHGYTPYGFAAINALILAKVMLVADDLHLGRRFEHLPLVYSILFKAAAFAIVCICFYVVEETVVGMVHGKTAMESVPRIGGTLRGILIAASILTVELIPFFAFSEISRVIGRDKLHALLFMRSPSRPQQLRGG